MGEVKYIVMDGCMLLNKSSTVISENSKERNRQAVIFSGDLTCRKTEKSSQTNDRKVVARTESSLLLTTFHLVDL